MGVEFSRDDYLWLEIQKQLLKLQELTTDVVYSKIVYKALLNNLSNLDIVSYSQNNTSEDFSLISNDYFDYKQIKNKFVLQQVLEVLKFIERKERFLPISNKSKFFFDTLKRVTFKNSEKLSTQTNKQTKVVIQNYPFSSLHSAKASKNQNNVQLKSSTVYTKG